jgi:hypothetical protein
LRLPLPPLAERAQRVYRAAPGFRTALIACSSVP